MSKKIAKLEKIVALLQDVIAELSADKKTGGKKAKKRAAKAAKAAKAAVQQAGPAKADGATVPQSEKPTGKKAKRSDKPKTKPKTIDIPPL